MNSHRDRPGQNDPLRSTQTEIATIMELVEAARDKATRANLEFEAYLLNFIIMALSEHLEDEK